MNHVEIIGWCGVALILSAYIMLVFGVISEASPLYLSLNLVGAFAVMYLSYKKKNFQPMVLNIVWSAVALIGLVRVFFFI